MDDLYSIQEKREETSVGEGAARYFKNLSNMPTSDTKPGDVLLTGSAKVGNMVEESPVMAFAHTLESARQRVEDGKAGSGRPSLAMGYLRVLEMPIVAYITMRVVVNGAIARDKLTTVLMRISQYIEDQYVFEQLCEDEPNLARASLRSAAKWTSAQHRRTIIRGAADLANVKGLTWSKGDKLRLGTYLYDTFVTGWTHEGVRIIETHKESEGKNRTPYRLRPSAFLADWLQDSNNKTSVLRPKYMPMVVPPRDWTSVNDGGYLTTYGKVKFVRDMSNCLRDDLMSLHMTPVFSAVNRAQATPWRVNEKVRDVMQQAWDEGSRLGDMPPVDDLPIPARPADIPRDMRVADMTDAQVSKFKDWRVKAAKKYTENATWGGRRNSLMTQLDMAGELTNLSRFWFPHSVDFRGRLYSIVPELNPQSDDFGKAMLEFADGKPLGEYGPYWLAVHIANLFGVDKVSFDDRVRWVEENTNAILDSAISPLDGHRFWCEADKPWCALAACIEWLGFQTQGTDYISHIPVAMDGSCSGLQHFSAMLLDGAGALAVNLTANKEPADIYCKVQERTEELLLLENDNVSYAWRSKVTRKIVKRPCMTFAYSVTSRGIRDQILDELRKASGETGYLPGFDNWEAASYLAPIVEQAIKDTVERASEAMDWLKESVRILLDADRPITWSTPLGFVVQQHYNRSVGKKYFVLLDGIRRELVLREDSDKADRRKQASAVAPNFVHSMDAAHLQMVVNRMVDEGVTTSFAVIHDSFGVHACDIDELNYVIRDEFVKLYSVNQLEKFRNWVLSSLPADRHDDVPPVPRSGDFNIEEVRDADFFFA